MPAVLIGSGRCSLQLVAILWRWPESKLASKLMVANHVDQPLEILKRELSDESAAILFDHLLSSHTFIERLASLVNQSMI
jgi:hypothetical protein